MDADERAKTIQIALDEAGDDFNVFSGVYDPRREDLIADAEQATDLGVDGFFVMPPAGSMEVTTTIDAVNYPEIWVDHVRSVAEVADLPIIVHPTCPPSAQYGEGLPLETTRAVLEEVPSVVGWKMTYNWSGYERIARHIRSMDRHVGVLAAPGGVFHNAMASGYFDGTVSGSWNYALEPMIEHVEAGLEDDMATARSIWDEQLAELHGYIYGDYSRLHIRYKIAAWLRGLCSHPFMRPPMPNPTVDEIEELDRLLSDYAGLDTVDDTEQERIANELDSW
jgi:dihydrodipicolinate synthase/N-acetylneuraminate lyase